MATFGGIAKFLAGTAIVAFKHAAMRVSILAYDGCMGGEVFGFADILLVANRISQARGGVASPPFKVSIVGARHGEVAMAGGARLQVTGHGQSDLLVIPSFDFARLSDIDGVLSRLGSELSLVRQAAANHPVASICGGAFLLAEAGLLDGRRATTAWAMAPEFMRRYPTTRLDPKAILVRDDGITTCGAFTAFGELALAIVEEVAGASVARAVARFSLISTARTSQAPFMDATSTTRRSSPFARDVERWLAQHLAERYSLNVAARAFGLSNRTFLRRVKAQTGGSPLDLLQGIRIDQAKRLLETTGLALDEVARRVGYLDVPNFYRLFQRRASMTPAVYRRQFRPPVRNTSGSDI